MLDATMDLLFSVFITISLYLWFPILLILIDRKFSKHFLWGITICNAIIMFSIKTFFLFYIYGSSSPNISPALFWSFIGYILMRKRILKDTNLSDDDPVQSCTETAPSAVFPEEKSSFASTGLKCKFFNKSFIFLGAVLFLICVFFLSQYNQLYAQIHSMEDTIQAMQSTIETTSKSLAKLQNLQNKLEDNFVLLNSKNNTYHKLSCDSVSSSGMQLVTFQEAFSSRAMAADCCYNATERSIYNKSRKSSIREEFERKYGFSTDGF